MKSKLYLLLLPFIYFSISANIISTEHSLYQAYQKYFPIGCAISPESDLLNNEKKYFIAKHYNSVTAENQMKLRFIHPKEFLYNWDPADKIVAFAISKNMKVRGHTLVWHQNLPEWLIKDGDNIASKELLFRRLDEHIKTVVGHFKTSVYCWDVVNEAISDKPNEIFRANDTLFAIAGEDYVDMSFRMAHKYNPAAKLFYNDYRFSSPEKRKKIFNLLKKLKDRGVPIDGVGFQCHLVPNEVTESYMQETIDMFSQLGLEIQITELDVSVYNYRNKLHPDSKIEDDEYSESRKSIQEEMYKMLFRVFRKNKDKITGVTFWGSADSRKSFRTNRIGKMDYPFLFDEFLNPKKAFFTVTSF